MTDITVCKKFKLSGMHCTSCSLLIEGELEDVGVRSRVDFYKQDIEVTFDPKKITEDTIIQTIRNIGYDIIGDR